MILKSTFISFLFFFSMHELIAQQFVRPFSAKDTLAQNGNVYRNYTLRFELMKSKLDPGTCPVLDSLALFLKQNDKLKIEIGVHTDGRKSQYELSEPRARAIAAYLIAQGIDSMRLKTFGYSNNKLINSLEQIEALEPDQFQMEKAYARNRRVEFVILRDDSK